MTGRRSIFLRRSRRLCFSSSTFLSSSQFLSSPRRGFSARLDIRGLYVIFPAATGLSAATSKRPEERWRSRGIAEITMCDPTVGYRAPLCRDFLLVTRVCRDDPLFPSDPPFILWHTRCLRTPFGLNDFQWHDDRQRSPLLVSSFTLFNSDGQFRAGRVHSDSY